MDIKEIEDMWDIDSDIDGVRIDEESRKISKLHSKYLRILTTEKSQLNKLNYKIDEYVLDKKEFYLGILSKEKLDKYGWVPFGRKILKSELQSYIDGDNDVNKLFYVIEEQKIKVDAVERIIYSINQRSMHLKNFVDWKKYTNGDF